MGVDLTKTIVVVTGANRGIGYQVVASLLEAPSGSYHIYLGTRDVSKGEAAMASLPTSKNNSTVSVVAVDIASHQTIAAAAEQIGKEAKRIDVLINNAGINISTAETAVERMNEVIAVNLLGTYAMTELFKPLLLTQPTDLPAKEKRLINLTSDLGSVTCRSDTNDQFYHLALSEYRVSKAAINMMTMCYLEELGHHGVKSFAYNPGLTKTDMTAGIPNVEAIGRDSRHSAEEVARVVEGQRDSDSRKMIDYKSTLPW